MTKSAVETLRTLLHEPNAIIPLSLARRVLQEYDQLEADAAHTARNYIRLENESRRRLEREVNQW